MESLITDMSGLKIKPRIVKKRYICYGCGAFTKEKRMYEGDEETWCEECFMTPEKLAQYKKRMPVFR